MPSFVDRHIAPEMLGLLLTEATLSWAVAYAVLTGGASIAPVEAFNAALGIAIAIGCTSLLLGLYRPERFVHINSLLLSTALGGVVAFPVAWGVGHALGIDFDWLLGHDHLWPTKLLFAWIAALFAVRLGFLAAVRSKLFVRRVAIIGDQADTSGTISAIGTSRAVLFEVVQTSHSSPAAMRRQRVRMAVATPAEFDLLGPIGRASFQAAGIVLAPEAEFWERHLKRIDTDRVAELWHDGLERQPGEFAVLATRAMDVTVSLALLLFTLPLMLLVALLIRLDSRGTVLYRQERVGLGGRSFTLLKFRSMDMNAEMRGPAWAAKCDPRITRVGALMRRTRIDELPQLLNVLRGEMSLVGPRPERPHFVEQLAAAIPHYHERLRVKPGLTGWAQVNYPYGASVEDARNKLSYDLYYVKHRSPMLYLVILVSTVRVILFQEGAR